MYHMSITVQEAYLLADILDRHLDDYVEELTREKFSNPNTDQTKPIHTTERGEMRQSHSDRKQMRPFSVLKKA